MNRELRLPVFLSTYNMTRKYKKISLQYSYLQLEIEDIKEACLIAAEDLEKEYRKKYGTDNNTTQKPTKEPPKEPTQEPDTNPENDYKKTSNKNSDLKKLYRKIATLTDRDWETKWDI